MPDIDAVGKAEAQDRFRGVEPQVPAESQVAASAPRVPPQQERLVQVRLSLLRNLQEFQKDLDAYITGYICSREMDELCQVIASKLELGTKETFRLGDSVYWGDIRREITSVSRIVIALPHLIRLDFDRQVEEFEKCARNVSNNTAGPAHSPAGADVMNIAREALRSIELMRTELMTITVRSKQNADRALADIKNVIKNIFDLIEPVPGGLASELNESLVHYETRRPQEAIEREKKSLGWTEGGASRPDTIDRSRR